MQDKPKRETLADSMRGTARELGDIASVQQEPWEITDSDAKLRELYGPLLKP